MRSLDNIQNSFADRFDPQNLENEGWNEPSDAIWDQIETTLDDSDEEPRVFGLYILLTCFIVSLVGIGILVNQNNILKDNLLMANQKLDSTIDQISIFKMDDNYSVKESKNQNTTAIANEKNDKLPLEENERIETSKESRINIPELRTVKTKSNVYKVREDNYSEVFIADSDSNVKQEYRPIGEEVSLIKSSGVLASANQNSLNDSKEKSFIQIEAIKSISFDLKTVHSAHEYLGLLPIVEPIRQNVLAGAFLVFGIESSIVQLDKTGFQESALSELIDREFGDEYISISAEYGKSISSQWSITAGLELNRQSFITEYDITLPYDVGQEIVENGVGYIDFEHSLPTSFGNTDTGFRLVRRNADAPLEEENVSIDFDTKHTFVSVHTPINMNYHLISPSEGLFIGVEAAPFYILDARSGIESVVSQHSEILSINSESKSDYNTLTRANVRVGLNLGYRLPVFQNSGVELDLGYSQNLRPHFATNNFSSQLSGINFKAGYVVNF